ncbi:MAG TPA: hypothetical protein VNG51_20110 [Ktedonobacteraceae bacterium]|nr:hypothetical protein [Ktedonobacteraceae bacterium]
MRKELPIAQCMFGWGQVFRLYRNMLDVQGKCYALKDLTHIRPIYQHIMGVDSVRLELHFGKKQVTLRGISAIDEAQKAIDYLTSQYLGITQANVNATGTATFHNWERERKTQFKTIPKPVFPLVQQSSPNALDAIEEDVAEEPVHAFVDGFLDSTLGTKTGDLGLPLEDIETLDDDCWGKEVCLQEFAQAPTAKVETPTPNWQHFRKEQHERRQHRLDVARSLREHGFDVGRLVRKLEEEPLPVVHVPVCLQDGEIAHYSVDATLCDEPIGEAIRYTYPAKDHGTLILTNTRMIYMGRKSQVVLDYGRLLHISRLRGAVAFQATHWYRREIFELRRPLECVMYIEAILKCFQHRVETRHSESFNEACTENIGVAEINMTDGVSTVNAPSSMLSGL